MLAFATSETFTGKEFKLDWFNAPNGHPAQVEWIEIEYHEVLQVSGMETGGFND